MKEIIKEIDKDRLLLQVNCRIYDKEAIIQASYKFTDRCYIHIDPINEEIIGVYFKPKQEDGESLNSLADQFCNEIIDQQVRLDTEKEFKHIRDSIVKKAFESVDS